MLHELQLLLADTPADAGLEVYRAAVVEANVLGKRSSVTRRATLRFLRELFALEPSVLLFRGLRDLWELDRAAQPHLALLCSVARDPLLRASAPHVLELVPGTTVSAPELASCIATCFPDRYRPNILSRTGRNLLASWRQAGFVAPAPRRERVRAQATVPATAYALLLGYLCGARGEVLFETLWARLLDAPPHVVRELAAAASRQGWLEYRQAGGVTEISFRQLLRPDGSEP
jgi:hypothetical protein